MAKKKKRSGGGGCGQQQRPAAEEGEEQAVVDNTAAFGEGQAQKPAEEGQARKPTDDKDKEKKALAPVVTAVLKVEMHCDGCAKRIRGSVRRFPGVEGVAMEVDKGAMTVVGRFDAKKLRDRVANKTKKKVDLVGNNNNNKGGGGGGGDKGGGGGCNHKGNKGEGKPDKEEEEEQEQQDDKGKDDKGGGGNAGKGKGGKDNKKPVVPVVGTVVLKIGAVGLHCDGCMNRIRSKLFKIKGVEQVAMEMAKNQVTVTGTMDIKTLPEKLRKKLRRPVDVVPPNKQQQQQQQQQDGKDKDNKQQQDGKDKDAAAKALTAEMEAWTAAFYDQQAPQGTELMLSDENPNACSVM